MFIFTIVVYALIGFFTIKTVFYDFPFSLNTNSWKDYVVNVSIIIIVIGVLCLFGYLAGGL